MWDTHILKVEESVEQTMIHFLCKNIEYNIFNNTAQLILGLSEIKNNSKRKLFIFFGIEKLLYIRAVVV